MDSASLPVEASPTRSTVSGDCWYCLVSRFTQPGMVAENSSVWRSLGEYLRMASTSSSNPSLSMRSASSRMAKLRHAKRLSGGECAALEQM